MILSLMCACLAALAADGPSWQAREPLDVSSRGLQPVSIAPVVGAESQRTALMEQARALGWPVVSDSEEADFVVAGRITEAYGARLGRDDGRAVDVRWTLTDVATSDVLYEVTTRGWVAERDKGAEPLSVAFGNLLAREPVAVALTPLPEPEGDDLMRIASCRTAPMPLPERLPQLLPVVVRVEQDGGIDGRGVLISPDGFVLTGAPLSAGVELAKVALSSGVSLEATVVRSDSSGVSLLKLPGSGFPCAPPAPTFKVGMPVYAMQDGGMLAQGTLLDTPEVDGLTLVQTDALTGAGGPLLDGTGGIVGVTTARGFAVPMALARARLQVAWGERTGDPAPEPERRIAIVALDADDPPIVALDARICVYRPRRGDPLELDVGSRLVTLNGADYRCVLLPSGTHSVGLSGAMGPAGVTVAAGETKYFRVLGKIGVEAESERAFERARDKGLTETR